MTSAERAKQRLQRDVAKKLEPYREVLESADIQCDLEREVDRLKQELATTQEQLRETQISNANYRTQLMELMAQGATEAGEIEE